MKAFAIAFGRRSLPRLFWVPGRDDCSPEIEGLKAMVKSLEKTVQEFLSRITAFMNVDA